tara:strand:- start:527 stop:877 length:351 start_codon:yes stop_codon:yes gene_type:complete
MTKGFLYNVLIMIVLIMKISFVIISIIFAYGKRKKWDKTKLYQIEELKEESLIVGEAFMYLVLLITFFPKQNAENIRVKREEQLSFFILGLLGLLHTDWNQFSKFFLHAGDTISHK